MRESPSKRPPHTPVAETPRAAVSAMASAVGETVSAPPVPPAVPALVRNENRARLPEPAALFEELAHAADAFADEMTRLTQSGFANAGETATAMLSAKTLTDALEISARFSHKSIETMLSGSLRLSDIMVRLAGETLRLPAPAR